MATRSWVYVGMDKKTMQCSPMTYTNTIHWDTSCWWCFVEHPALHVGWTVPPHRAQGPHDHQEVALYSYAREGQCWIWRMLQLPCRKPKAWQLFVALWLKQNRGSYHNNQEGGVQNYLTISLSLWWLPVIVPRTSYWWDGSMCNILWGWGTWPTTDSPLGSVYHFIVRWGCRLCIKE